MQNSLDKKIITTRDYTQLPLDLPESPTSNTLLTTESSCENLQNTVTKKTSTILPNTPSAEKSVESTVNFASGTSYKYQANLASILNESDTVAAIELYFPKAQKPIRLTVYLHDIKYNTIKNFSNIDDTTYYVVDYKIKRIIGRSKSQNVFLAKNQSEIQSFNYFQAFFNEKNIDQSIRNNIPSLLKKLHHTKYFS